MKLKALRLSKVERTEFWSFVDCKGSEECWLWQGGRNGDCYGYFKQRRAHRLAYYLTYGQPKHFVLHTCRNRLCCNPKHLYDGTHLQNMDDMIKDGTHDGKNRRCEKHPCYKLTTQEVKFIQRSNARGIDLAKDFGVSQALISMIRHRRKRCYD